MNIKKPLFMGILPTELRLEICKRANRYSWRFVKDKLVLAKSSERFKRECELREHLFVLLSQIKAEDFTVYGPDTATCPHHRAGKSPRV